MPEPQIIWSRTIQDAEGDDVTLDAYDDGDVRITIQEHLSGLRGHGEAVFSREGRGEFDSAYQEACRHADGGHQVAVTVAASVDPGDAEALGMVIDQLADPAQRMAITPDGVVKPVSEFAAEEKWWCDGEDCNGSTTVDGPHVHPGWGLPTLRVDLLTGKNEHHPEYGKQDDGGEARDA